MEGQRLPGGLSGGAGGEGGGVGGDEGGVAGSGEGGAGGSSGGTAGFEGAGDGGGGEGDRTAATHQHREAPGPNHFSATSRSTARNACFARRRILAMRHTADGGRLPVPARRLCLHAAEPEQPAPTHLNSLQTTG